MSTKFLFILLVAVAVVVLTACSSSKVHSFNKTMAGIAHGVKAVDFAATEVSKGASQFTKHIEKYVDTSSYRKDSAGMWHARWQFCACISRPA